MAFLSIHFIAPRHCCGMADGIVYTIRREYPLYAGPWSLVPWSQGLGPWSLGAWSLGGVGTTTRRPPPPARPPPAGLCVAPTQAVCVYHTDIQGSNTASVSATQIYRPPTQPLCLLHRYLRLQHSLCVCYTDIQASNTACVSLAQIYKVVIAENIEKVHQNHQNWYEPGSGVSVWAETWSGCSHGLPQPPGMPLDP